MTDEKRKTILSTMWIFVMLNMIYADILGMLRPGYLAFLERMSQEPFWVHSRDVTPESVLLQAASSQW